MVQTDPKLSKYRNFHSCKTQQDPFECLLLLMDIMDKGFGSYSTGEYMATSYRDSQSELLFSFFWKTIFLWCMRTQVPFIWIY